MKTWAIAILLALLLAGCSPPPRDEKESKNHLFKGSKTNAAQMETGDAYWEKAYLETYVSASELAAKDEREKRSGKNLPKLMRGPLDKPLLALTFDDGPHPGLTEKLLQILDDENVKATFFVIGKMVEKHPELLKQIDSAGHEVANHTFSHVTLTKIPVPDIETEYRANNDVVSSILGKKMTYCRPPGGDYDADVIQAATAVRLKTVLWTDDPGDYANPGEQVILQRTLSKLSNGGIILLHDGASETLTVLPQIIEFAKAKGFKFVTVSELDKAR